MDRELTPEEREQRNADRSDVDDGVGGPSGDRFRAGVLEAGDRLGFAADPRGSFTWVATQPWHGRALTIDRSTFGAQGRTTGYRWIAIRLSTARLGVWADAPTRTTDRIVGVGLPVNAGPTSPTGVWWDDPGLLADLWAFTVPLLPHRDPDERELWVHLNVGNDFVVWHLRVSVLDGASLIAAIELLERVAIYAERNDVALSARLGRSPGVTAHRRLEVQLALGAIAVVLVIVLIVAAIAIGTG